MEGRSLKCSAWKDHLLEKIKFNFVSNLILCSAFYFYFIHSSFYYIYLLILSNIYFTLFIGHKIAISHFISDLESSIQIVFCANAYKFSFPVAVYIIFPHVLAYCWCIIYYISLSFSNFCYICNLCSSFFTFNFFFIRDIILKLWIGTFLFSSFQHFVNIFAINFFIALR